MQREILFRGKKLDTGDWIYGNLFTINNTMVGNIFTAIVPTPDYYLGDFIFDDWILQYIVIPESVGQYTALLDKEGNKIFEGDIVKADWGYGKKATVVKLNDIIFAYVECTISDKIEVIGNIFDNSELVEQ